MIMIIEGHEKIMQINAEKELTFYSECDTIKRIIKTQYKEEQQNEASFCNL